MIESIGEQIKRGARTTVPRSLDCTCEYSVSGADEYRQVRLTSKTSPPTKATVGGFCTWEKLASIAGTELVKAIERGDSVVEIGPHLFNGRDDLDDGISGY